MLTSYHRERINAGNAEVVDVEAADWSTMLQKVLKTQSTEYKRLKTNENRSQN